MMAKFECRDDGPMKEFIKCIKTISENKVRKQDLSSPNQYSVIF